MSAADPRARPLPIRARLWRAVVLLLPALSLLALAEGLVRIAAAPVDGLDTFVRSPALRDDFGDRDHVRIFEGDALLFWRLKPNLRHVVWDYTLVSTNDAGLRHERPLRPRQPGSVRIACVGDSVTFGFRVPLVFPEHPGVYPRDDAPYPTLLARRLRAANPQRDIEVVNMGVPGYSSQQASAWLRRDLKRIDSDLLTVCLGWNDVSLQSQPDRVAMPMDGAHVIARRIVGSSQLLLRAASALQSLRWREPAPPPATVAWSRVGQEEYVANLLAMGRLARSRGIDVVLIAPVFGGSPWVVPESERLTAYRIELRQAAAREGFAYLEVRDLTEAAFPGNAALFPTEPIHPGAEGHRRLADALLRLLDEEGMLGSLGLVAPPPEVAPGR